MPKKPHDQYSHISDLCQGPRWAVGSAQGDCGRRYPTWANRRAPSRRSATFPSILVSRRRARSVFVSRAPRRSPDRIYRRGQQLAKRLALAKYRRRRPHGGQRWRSPHQPTAVHGFWGRFGGHAASMSNGRAEAPDTSSAQDLRSSLLLSGRRSQERVHCPNASVEPVMLEVFRQEFRKAEVLRVRPQMCIEPRQLVRYRAS
jgi:hypothetical protein